MGTAMNLAEAVQAVAARRSQILALLNLSPKVFDSWMDAATNDAGSPEGQHALLILASWIQGLPELGAARETILLACERKVPAASEPPVSASVAVPQHGDG